MSRNDDGPYWRGINHLALITRDMETELLNIGVRLATTDAVVARLS